MVLALLPQAVIGQGAQLDPGWFPCSSTLELLIGPRHSPSGLLCVCLSCPHPEACPHFSPQL